MAASYQSVAPLEREGSRTAKRRSRSWSGAMEEEATGGGRVRRVALSVAYGLVAAAMCAPVMMSFASIIFGDPFFGAELPSLVNLVLVSSAVHQLCYVSSSTLPFAVGQVQDAGLIFLSSMARTVVLESGESAASTTAACLWVLAAATATLGAMLVVVGRLRLASLAQYLPVPVVGGYLAYIGFYCGQAGLAMMSGVELVRLRDWRGLWTADAARRTAPGFAVAAAILCATSRVRGMTARAMVVPGVLALAVACFYATCWLTGTTLEEARAAGWVGSSHSGAGLPWRLYVPAAPGEALRLAVRALPKVAPTWLGMVVVVAFSSSLDVAAIEMELGRPLDYDAELRTVGLGNLCSGCLGGFSGSYIFSQTILNMRSRAADRLSGLVVVAAELALALVAPVPPTAVVPTCAFGGTLIMIAIDLQAEWLWHARRRFSASEFLVDLFTFAAIQALGLETGFAAGLVAAAFAFAVSHGPSDAVFKCRPSPVTRSVVLRACDQRAFLSSAVAAKRLVVLELRGFVFFGAAAQLLAKLRTHLRLDQVDEEDDELGPPAFAVLDCVDFAGSDATAARACFKPLARQLAEVGTHLLFAGLEADVAANLRGHGVDVSRKFPTLDAALERAEDALLSRRESARETTPGGGPPTSIRDILLTLLDRDPAVAAALDAAPLDAYFAPRRLARHDVLFDAGSTGDTLFFLADGLVDFTLAAPPGRRILRVTTGGVVGELAFFLRRPQRFTATCAQPSTVFALRRREADAMRADHPHLALLLHTALLNTLCLQVEDSLGSACLDHLAPATAHHH